MLIVHVLFRFIIYHLRADIISPVQHAYEHNRNPGSSRYVPARKFLGYVLIKGYDQRFLCVKAPINIRGRFLFSLLTAPVAAAALFVRCCVCVFRIFVYFSRNCGLDRTWRS